MKRGLRYERVMSHPPELIWRALTEAELMSRWLMETEFVPEVGFEFTFRSPPNPTYDGIIYGEVILVDNPVQVAYTFIGGHMKHKTVVTWTLIPEGEKTRLILEHEDFLGLRDIFISAIIGFGWNRMLNSLPALLDELAHDKPSEEESNPTN